MRSPKSWFSFIVRPLISETVSYGSGCWELLMFADFLLLSRRRHNQTDILKYTWFMLIIYIYVFGGTFKKSLIGSILSGNKKSTDPPESLPSPENLLLWCPHQGGWGPIYSFPRLKAWASSSHLPSWSCPCSLGPFVLPALLRFSSRDRRGPCVEAETGEGLGQLWQGARRTGHVAGDTGCD